ncbi:MAG: 2-(1,2-epoxy-1,2-dihydrophenyl)acetyl-CoA isomerase PaaG [Phenylobacterium sp.]|uniref:2-(1,2-epoxy-1,2-dihydrophenyl)acetyl-CoA isomerase PaaG n=1 Tax=Phenylobacterium sp. TaxID=1871053 RepID=UPI0025DC0DAB|nr:2-(1,2-epoxy-1,2-dihydrophenyl)acetyl-CoA isomerase PaaG [Phenylobacterium sp.]MCG9917532.1 2-(1,2-epoxy-1,2-dihydrophenyl)acetyl-CoA isomerase PaaG [Phenylobacterium sp.]
MSYATIHFEIEDAVAKLTFDRPDRLNAFTAEMHGEVADALDAAEREGARSVLITGSGRGFCAGQDLNDRAVAPGGEKVDLGASVERFYNPLITRLTTFPAPVVCAVNGVAAGAGANIAFACDIVLAGRSARFIESFSAIGLIPDSGGTWHLPRLAGLPRAMGMALTGEPIDAERAAQWGLIWKCVEDDELASEALALATKFAQGPTQGLAATKRAIRGAMLRSLEEQLERERDLMRTLGQTNDYGEGVAAFLDKRRPRFTGH